MRLHNVLLAGTSAIALLLPALAHAQTVTPTKNNGTGQTNQNSIVVATPGATHVGDVMEIFVGYYGTGVTATATDAAGNASSQTPTVTASGSVNTTFGWRVPITVASSSAENVTVNFASPVNYDWMVVEYLPTPHGYSFAGSDFTNTQTLSSSGTMTLSGSATQGNDFVSSADADSESGIGGGQTTLIGPGGQGQWVSYGQPSASGSYSQTYTGGSAGDAGVLIAEKVSALPTATQCGTSVTPSVSSGKYVLQCQLDGNLVINNPTGLSSGGGDSFMIQLQQPASEPVHAYTVTFGSAYNQSGAPAANPLSGLSTTADAVDDVFGVSMPLFTNVWSAQRVEISTVYPNMGN